MAEDLEVPLDEELDFTLLVFPTELVGRWALFPLFSSWSWRLAPPSISSLAGWHSFSSAWWSIVDSLSLVLGGLSLRVFKLGGYSWKVDGKEGSSSICGTTIWLERCFSLGRLVGTVIVFSLHHFFSQSTLWLLDSLVIRGLCSILTRC